MRHIFPLLIVLTLIISESIAAQGDSTKTVKTKSAAAAVSLIFTLVPVAGGAAIIGQNFPFGDEAEAERGAVLMLAGLVVGPSTGHIYAEARKPLLGISVRCLCIAVILAGTRVFDSDIPAIPGSMLFVGSIIHDFATLGKSVDEYNRRHEQSTISIAPTYWPKHGAVGLSASLPLSL